VRPGSVAAEQAVTREGKDFPARHRRCPDLNPIEQAGTSDHRDNLDRISALLNWFTPQECANYFANAAYAST
jgi:hypothetical protein